MFMRSSCLWLAALILCPPAVYSATIHVPADQPTIQAGIDAAVNGDTVLVAPGVYSGTGNRDVVYRGNNIVLRSERGPDHTTIDCQGDSLQPHRAFVFAGGEDSSAELSGLTIINGYGHNDHPAGVSQAGAVYCAAGSSPTITDCVFRYNRCGFVIPQVGPGEGVGGAIVCRESSPKIARCRFFGNVSGYIGGAIFCYDYAQPRIEECYFECDTSAYGGAIYCWQTSPIITDCAFLRNKGGAIYCDDNAGPTISRCTMVSNTYGISSNAGSSPQLTQCIIAFSPLSAVCNVYPSAEQPSFFCCDLYGNKGGDWVGIIAEQATINDNFSLDPRFCDTSASDCFLRRSSPCTAENSPCGQQVGAFGIGCFDAVTSFGIIGQNIGHITAHTPEFFWQLYDPEFNEQDSFTIVVGADEDWQCAEMWNPPPLLSSDTAVTYAGAPLVDGETYYWRLRVHMGENWSLWYDSSFRVNSVPTVPVQLSPGDGKAAGSMPTLWVHNSADAESDPLRYDFTGFHDTDCVAAPPLESIGVPQGIDSTGAQVDLTAGENCRYWWSVRAFDGYEYSTPTSTRSFYVDGVPEPPTAPNPIWPPDTAAWPVYDMLPTFLWSESFDPDPLDTVRYKFQLCIDSTFTFVNTVDSLASTSCTLTDSLDFATRYWWRVYAFDRTGHSIRSPWQPLFWTWTLGDVTHSNKVNVADLTYLLTFMFGIPSGLPPNPMFVGDINGDCKVNISDVTYLLNYLFGIPQGPEPRVGCAP